MTLNPQDIWHKVLGCIQVELSEQSFKTWFQYVACTSITNDVAQLEVPDKFYGDWLLEHYHEIIRSAFQKIIGTKPALLFAVNPKGFAQEKQPDSLSPCNSVNEGAKQSLPAKKSPEAPMLPNNYIASLNEMYTFDSFVVGPGNRFSHAAAVAISESPAKTYNPFFIYGPSGLGKTHLMQAIAHRIRTLSPTKKVFYTSSESFMNSLINSIHKRNTTEFRKKFRSLDVLLIDDIHFIAGKESTQEEFFHTFNALYDAKKQIILSSDRSPKEIPSLEGRLLSRFEWGLTTDIQPPDFETRVAILKKKLERENVDVSNDILFYIAENISTNIRELEGALIRVCAYATLQGDIITLPTVQQILHTSLKEEEKKKITIEVIQQYVAELFNVSIAEIRAKRRTKNIVYPRQIAMFLARKYTNKSLPEIGECFGGRGHATVLHACNKIQTLINNGGPIVEQIAEIEKKLT